MNISAKFLVFGILLLCLLDAFVVEGKKDGKSGKRGKRGKGKGRKGGKSSKDSGGEHEVASQVLTCSSCTQTICSAAAAPTGVEGELICNFYRENGCMVCSTGTDVSKDSECCSYQSLTNSLFKEPREAKTSTQEKRSRGGSSGNGGLCAVIHKDGEADVKETKIPLWKLKSGVQDCNNPESETEYDKCSITIIGEKPCDDADVAVPNDVGKD